MNKIAELRLDRIEYLLGELEELRLHYHDLKAEHYLLHHDHKAIRKAVCIQKLILTRDYFKVEDELNGEIIK